MAQWRELVADKTMLRGRTADVDIFRGDETKPSIGLGSNFKRYCGVRLQLCHE